MKTAQRKLMLDQLEKKLDVFSNTASVPDQGWIQTIRTALNMSLVQLGKRLGITSAGVQQIEKREQQGAITINSLENTARGMHMKLVYGFVPLDGSLETMIEKRAHEIALDIVKRTSDNMKLEDQQNSKERLQKAIEQKREEIISELPKYLWD